MSFTKRTDHDAGRHRTSRAHSEPEVCTECSSVYRNRRWVSPTAIQTSKPLAWERMKETVCPACKAQAEGVPSGFVYLDGSFFAGHRKEIEHFLERESKRAAEDNPLARIMGRVLSDDGVLTVTTTTEHLAKRLGQALQKAFGGNVRYDFSHENKLARVYWRRDVEKPSTKKKV